MQVRVLLSYLYEQTICAQEGNAVEYLARTRGATRPGWKSSRLPLPSLLQTSEQHAFGLKVITVMPSNPSQNMPCSYASVLLLDANTGKTLAILVIPGRNLRPAALSKRYSLHG